MSERLHKTRGIVFRFTKYRDTSIIATIFTEIFGLQTYIINGIRSSGKNSRIALFQPLTLLDMVVYHRDTAQIFRIKEYHCDYPYHTLLTDVNKSVLAMFLDEVLNKSVKDQSHPEEIFSFIRNSLIHLDQQQSGFENFHLIFLVKLSRLLGFGIQNGGDSTLQRISKEESLIDHLLKLDYTGRLNLNYDQRKDLLHSILQFYSSQIDHFGPVKSVQVLQEVLR